MVQFDPVPTAVPPLALQILGGLARHGMTYVAGILATAGALTGDQQAQFISIGVSLLLAGASYAWSVIQKRNVKKAT